MLALHVRSASTRATAESAQWCAATELNNGDKCFLGSRWVAVCTIGLPPQTKLNQSTGSAGAAGKNRIRPRRVGFGELLKKEQLALSIDCLISILLFSRLPFIEKYHRVSSEPPD